MKKQNDYQKFFAIKRALKNSQDLTYNGERIAYVDLTSVHVLAGTTYLAIRKEFETDEIFADIQQIEIL